MRKNKFKKGKAIRSMAALSDEISSGRYIYLNHKPFHPGWTQSMTWRALYNFVASGRAFYAKDNE